MKQKLDGVVFEDLGNGLKNRYHLNAISCDGGPGYKGVTANTVVTMHNAKILCDAELQPVTEDLTGGGKVTATIGELLESLGVTFEQFAITWAALTVPDPEPGV